METGVITLHESYKIYNFTLSVSSIAEMVSAVRNDRDRPLPAVRLIELVVRKFHRKSSDVCLFNTVGRNYTVISQLNNCIVEYWYINVKIHKKYRS